MKVTSNINFYGINMCPSLTISYILVSFFFSFLVEIVHENENIFYSKVSFHLPSGHCSVRGGKAHLELYCLQFLLATAWSGRPWIVMSLQWCACGVQGLNMGQCVWAPMTGNWAPHHWVHGHTRTFSLEMGGSLDEDGSCRHSEHVWFTSVTAVLLLWGVGG